MYGRLIEQQGRETAALLSQKDSKSLGALGATHIMDNGTLTLCLDLASIYDYSSRINRGFACDETKSLLNMRSINLPEMNLAHHFDVITSCILPYGQSFWKEIVATVASKVS